MIVVVQHDNVTNRHRLPVVDALKLPRTEAVSRANCSASYERVIRRAASKNYEVSKIRVTF